MTEALSVNIARGLAAAAWLMARTPLAGQPWKGAGATLDVERGPAGTGVEAVRLSSPGLDLSDAIVAWETDANPVRLGAARASVSPRASWVEAEALLPDGRRVFAARELARR
jgi:hypothetical protein